MSGEVLESWNDIFLSWLKEFADSAQGNPGAFNYKTIYTRAISSLKACPKEFNHASELKELKYFGPSICSTLEKKQEQYCSAHGIQMPPKFSRRRNQVRAETSIDGPSTSISGTAATSSSSSSSRRNTVPAPANSNIYVHSTHNNPSVSSPLLNNPYATRFSNNVMPNASSSRSAQPAPTSRTSTSSSSTSIPPLTPSTSNPAASPLTSPAIIEALQELNNSTSNPATRRKRNAGVYIPKYRSGGYAILLTLYHQATMNGQGMCKADIIKVAHTLCDTSFAPDPGNGVYYSAWNNINTLMKKGLVCPSSLRNPIYSITEEGRHVAEGILKAEQEASAGGASEASSSRASTSNTATSRSNINISNNTKRPTVSLTEEELLVLLGRGDLDLGKAFATSVRPNPRPTSETISSASPGKTLGAIPGTTGQPLYNTINGHQRYHKNPSGTNNGNLSAAYKEKGKAATKTKQDGKDSPIIVIDGDSDEEIIQDSKPSSFKTKDKNSKVNSFRHDLQKSSLKEKEINNNNTSEDFTILDSSVKRKTPASDASDVFQTPRHIKLARTAINSSSPSAYSYVAINGNNNSNHDKVVHSSPITNNDVAPADMTPNSYVRAQLRQLGLVNQNYNSPTGSSQNSNRSNFEFPTSSPPPPIDEEIENIDESQYSKASLTGSPVSSKNSKKSELVAPNNANLVKSFYTSTPSFIRTGITNGNTNSNINNININNSNNNNNRKKQLEDGRYLRRVWPAGTFTIELFIDNREIRSQSERDFFVNTLSQKYRVPCRVENLTVGDLLWVAKEKNTGQIAVVDFIIERKRLDDLVASIKDGRFAEQKLRLKRSGLANITYLVEELVAMDKGIYAQQIQTAMSQVITHDGFFLKRTLNTEETVAVLAEMTAKIKEMYQGTDLYVVSPQLNTHKSYDLAIRKVRAKIQYRNTNSTNGKPILSLGIDYGSFQTALSKTAMVTIRDVFIDMLLTVKGITMDKAKVIQKKYPTPRFLLEAYQREYASQESPEKGDAVVKDMLFNDFGHLITKQRITKVLSEKIYQVWGKFL